MRNGIIIATSARSESMYNAIDEVSHKVARQLRKYKSVHNKHQYLDHEEMSKVAFNEDSEGNSSDDLLEETFSDIYSKITKKKEFDMPSIDLEEAIAQFGFIDHPFYVFRNMETNEINVLYKRAEGGIGHIVPKK